MLENFLKALEITGAVKELKRIVLITGAKQYGVHLGCPKNPMSESDPWLRDSKYPPNFYYRQQDILHKFCQTHANISWVVTYPQDVVGFAKGNFMNLASAVGLYATISKELGEDLAWPGSKTFYSAFNTFTGSKLHAKFCLWAALEPKASNQAFNVLNGDVESWQNLWPQVADRFGLSVNSDQFSDTPDAMNKEMGKLPPISDYETKAGLGGTIQPNRLEGRIDLSKWSQKSEVKEAWNKVAARHGLEKDALEKATWTFLQFVLGRNFSMVISMSKARKLGWTGYVQTHLIAFGHKLTKDSYQDTWDSLADVFDELELAKVLPKSN
jgi:nucleoside-diphosphate-sugar epimerase